MPRTSSRPKKQLKVLEYDHLMGSDKTKMCKKKKQRKIKKKESDKKLNMAKTKKKMINKKSK